MFIFIDSENVGTKKAESIIELARLKGKFYSVCAYARQNDNRTKRWHEKAMELGLKEKAIVWRTRERQSG